MTKGDNSGWATISLKSTSVDNSGAKKYTLSTTENTIIGRSPDCQIPLDPHEFITVSRRHAEIKLVDANWQISDLGTTNGTLVNDRPVNNPQQLESGDRITLGIKGAEFTFECLTLNATVMVQPTEIEAGVSEPARAKVETAPKPESKPEAIPDAIAKAKETIPASPEVKPPIVPAKPAPAAKLEIRAQVEVEPKPELEVEKKEAEPKPYAERSPLGEPAPKAKVEASPPVAQSNNIPTPVSSQAANSG